MQMYLVGHPEVLQVAAQGDQCRLPEEACRGRQWRQATAVLASRRQLLEPKRCGATWWLAGWHHLVALKPAHIEVAARPALAQWL